METRLEKDLIGQRPVPAERYWGIHTERALANFTLTGRRTPARLIRALALVKKAACQANAEIGALDDGRAAAIVRACDEVASGQWDGQFPLDAFQGGAGTSTNMNVNEVIANRALEILGHAKGRYDLLDPLEHVNLHQSTNDVYPTALKIAAIEGFRELAGRAADLQSALQGKEKEFFAVVKIGRTELQEAVPTTLGREFSAFAEAAARDRWRLFKCEERLRVTNIGGTAVGTGLGAPRRYIFLVIEKLRQATGFGLSRSENIAGDTAFLDPFVEVSGSLKAHAANLSKIANDLRLMNLLGEIRLPRVQAGSSIMPGKVNPVMLEAVIQAAMQIKANDAMLAECVSWGTFEINEFLPLIASALLDSIELLSRTDRLLTAHLSGIQADERRCAQYVDESRVLVTAMLPHIGYHRAEEVLAEFDASAVRPIRAFLEGKFGKELVSEALSPAVLTRLGHEPHAKHAEIA